MYEYILETMLINKLNIYSIKYINVEEIGSTCWDDLKKVCKQYPLKRLVIVAKYWWMTVYLRDDFTLDHKLYLIPRIKDFVIDPDLKGD